MKASMGTGKPVLHEDLLATWRLAYDDQQNSIDRPRTERREEVDVRPESGGYPKGDAVVDPLESIARESTSERIARESTNERIARESTSERIARESTRERNYRKSTSESTARESTGVRVVRGTTENGSRSTRELRVPLRRLIVGTEHVGRVFLIKKWHQYVKHLNFETVSHQLVSLRDQLARINPNEEGEFVKVYGKKDTYILSSTRASYVQNEIKCAEQDSVMLDLLQFQMEELASGVKDRMIVLEDMIIVRKDSLECKSRGTKIKGMNCVNRILRQTNWNGLVFKNITAGEWYKELMSKGESTLHIGVEDGKLLIAESMLGYTLCYRMSGANSSAELKTVVQGKYYNHLEKICGKIIARLEDRNGKLAELANLLIERKEIMSGTQFDRKRICGEWKELMIYPCVGARFNVSGDWENVFTVYRERFVLIDGYISTGLKQARASCEKEAKGQAGLARAYAGLVTFNLEVTEIARAYGLSDTKLERLSLLVSAETESSELKVCASQIIGRSLSDKEAMFVILQVYNAKIRSFKRIFPANAPGVGEFDVFETQRILLRTKRYIWTEGLAAITGLVPYSTVDDIKHNQNELKQGEETNSAQIVILEQETNLVLGNLRNQSEKMKTLYSDEKELQERLLELTRDETDILGTVSHLTEALEVASDVAVEFQSFMLGLELVPMHIEMLEKGVRSVLTQDLELDLLPPGADLSIRQIDDVNSLRMMRATMQISRIGYAVKFDIPELFEPFELVQVRALPFHMDSNSQMVRFKLERELVAANSVGESFLYPLETCTREQSTRVCDIRSIELHRSAVTCVESLLTDSEELPDLCKKSVAIVTPSRQEYVYHELESRVSIFSHVQENFTIDM